MTANPAQTDQPAADASTDDIVVKCAGLTKVFKDFWLRSKVRAVDGVDLAVRRGEVYGLLGPNGSGKSTTIKMILGLLHPTEGKIAVFGKRPEDVATKKQIGYLPEESYLYPFLNARETLDYYGRLFHQNGTQRKRRIEMLLSMVGLEAVQRRPVREYSKGMQRRIGIAQALINDPQLLVLDEPTTGMDPIGTAQIKDLIKALAAKGKTILLCSHLLADVEDVCDRVAVMYGGKVRAEGTVDELLTEQQMTTIETPHLDDETIEQIEQLLEARGGHIARVQQPRQTLEAFFLDIVHKAQTEGASTSGATSGGPIADFLMSEARSAHLPDDAEAAAIIDKLTQPEQEPDKPESKPVTPQAPAAPITRPTPADEHQDEDDGADTSVIAALAGGGEPQDEVEAQAPVAATPPASAADEATEDTGDVSVIQGLIGIEEDEPEEAEPPARDAALDMPKLDEKTVRRETTPQAEQEPAPVDDVANDAPAESTPDDPPQPTPADTAPAPSDDPPATTVADTPAPVESAQPEPTPELSATPPQPASAEQDKPAATPSADALPDDVDPSPAARLRRANEELLARLGQTSESDNPSNESSAEIVEPPSSESGESSDASEGEESADASFLDALREMGGGDEDDKPNPTGG